MIVPGRANRTILSSKQHESEESFVKAKNCPKVEGRPSSSRLKAPTNAQYNK